MHFYKLHSSVLVNATELTHSQKIIVSYIVNNAQKDGYCWSSRDTIAVECGISLATAKRGLKRLEALSYVKIVAQDKKGFCMSNHIYPLAKTLLLANEKTGGLKAALASEKKARKLKKDIANSQQRQLRITLSALSKTNLPYDEYHKIATHLSSYLVTY